jgi:hypothetical protein
MKQTFLLFIAVLAGLIQGAYGQTTVEADAVKNADSLLAALKIADIPEGRQAISAASWRPLFSIPVVLDYTTLYQGMFETDVSGVQGYKRLLEFKVQSKARTVLTARYILISYKDRKSNTWKVFDVRDISGTTVENAIEAYRQSGKPSPYWLTLGGKLQEAKGIMTLRNSTNQPEFQILQAIVGE